MDFGFSFWKSADAQREFPTLRHDDISPRGRFGIGFFSVFMWADDVEVISRRFNDSPNDAKVLHFRGGLDTRPLLRSAKGGEISTKWSTRVRLRIPKAKSNEIFAPQRRSPRSIEYPMLGRQEVLPRDWSASAKLLCAALPVQVTVDAFDTVSSASLPNWKSVSAASFVDFFNDIIHGHGKGGTERFSITLSDVRQGDVAIGRAYFVPKNASETDNAITVYDKGIYAGRIQSTCARGVVEGRVTNAARERFDVIHVTNDSRWVTEASEKAFAICTHPGEELGVQEALIRIGARADTRPLFVLNRTVRSAAALREHCRNAERLILRLTEDAKDQFDFEKVTNLDVIYGMHVDPGRLYTLIGIPGDVERDTDIVRFLDEGSSALARLLQEISTAMGPDCSVRKTLIERESYQKDLMDIEFSRD